MKNRPQSAIEYSESDEDVSEMASENSEEVDDDWDFSQVESGSNKKREIPYVEDDDDNSIPKKKKKLENDLYKAPTVDELNQLRETQNLFHSNLFRLQIEEVLSEVKLKLKYQKLFQEWFPKLKKQIESIKESKEFKV